MEEKEFTGDGGESQGISRKSLENLQVRRIDSNVSGEAENEKLIATTQQYKEEMIEAKEKFFSL